VIRQSDAILLLPTATGIVMSMPAPDHRPVCRESPVAGELIRQAGTWFLYGKMDPGR
jgi:hypothetical protein